MISSLNPTWSAKAFHERIADLTVLKPGETVLDLGCGRGATIAALLDRTAPAGRVTALDRDLTALEAIGQAHPGARAAGRLDVVTADIAAAFPFPESSFDAVICQNVMECVRDRGALVREIRRVVRPSGRLLAGHHDFDGIVLASDDRVLTRQLVHAFADYRQGWQDESDGQMGRLLPGLIAQGGFTRVTTETILFVDTSLAEGSYARAYLGWIRDLGEKLGASAVQLGRWLDAFEARSTAGTFYFAIPWVYVLAVK